MGVGVTVEDAVGDTRTTVAVGTVVAVGVWVGVGLCWPFGGGARSRHAVAKSVNALNKIIALRL